MARRSFANYLTSGSNVKQKWYVTLTHHLMVMHTHNSHHIPILNGKNVTALTSFANYMTLGSKVKVK